ncbi:hypothetical protein ABDK56_05585 [Sphingomonas sp. ASV193]|uniref:hypothetical protein n=1 Tax=Sphingomonas sp. ASV193 TaxID=3144405 RepID=UPI0032E8827B
MIHFIPDSPDQVTPLADEAAATGGPSLAGPYAEAVARLASIRQALACVERAAGDPPSDRDSEARLAVMWPSVGAARKRAFEARSARTASAAADGLEALAANAATGQPLNPAALRRLRAELGRGLDDLDLLFSL